MAALKVIVLLFVVTFDFFADRASGEQIKRKIEERMKRQVSVQNEDNNLDQRLAEINERFSKSLDQLLSDQSSDAVEESQKKLDAVLYVAIQQLDRINTLLERFPDERSCEEFRGNHQGEAYEIIPTRYGYELLCDTKTDGGGWTVFQRRIDGSVDFYRNWIDYENGFGDIRGTGYWLGLKHLGHIASQGNWEMRVNLKFNGTDYYAQYSYFKISDAFSAYKLTVAGYSGTAGESLFKKSSLRPFSTKDRDHDEFRHGSCAKNVHGAWWYGYCLNSNLNGKWGSQGVNGVGLVWESLTGVYDSASFTQMMIRPVR